MRGSLDMLKSTLYFVHLVNCHRNSPKSTLYFVHLVNCHRNSSATNNRRTLLFYMTFSERVWFRNTTIVVPVVDSNDALAPVSLCGEYTP